MRASALLINTWFDDEASTRLGVIIRMIACALLVVPGSSLLPGSRSINFLLLLIASYLLERRVTHAAVWTAIALFWRGWFSRTHALSYAVTCGVLGALVMTLAIVHVVRTRRDREEAAAWKMP